jgi:hypothetical protein
VLLQRSEEFPFGGIDAAVSENGIYGLSVDVACDAFVDLAECAIIESEDAFQVREIGELFGGEARVGETEEQVIAIDALQSSEEFTA